MLNNGVCRRPNPQVAPCAPLFGRGGVCSERDDAIVPYGPYWERAAASSYDRKLAERRVS